MTPAELTAKENEIFDALEHTGDDATFRGRLYRDGVPSPEIYLAQPVRILFVFREPNLPHAGAYDMRDQVRDVRFRRLTADGTRLEAPIKGWWNWKAGMFAHAVASALISEPWQDGYARFRLGGWNHEVVNRFGYIQIKKVGGKGTSDPYEICTYAQKYADILKRQIALYHPDLILGCGTGRHSPAQLIAQHVLDSGKQRLSKQTGARWWEFSDMECPRALVQLWHPARRGSQSETYEDVWSSVHDVLRAVGGVRR